MNIPKEDTYPEPISSPNLQNLVTNQDIVTTLKNQIIMRSFSMAMKLMFEKKYLKC